MNKERQKTVEYILKQNLKVVAKHYLSNPSLTEETCAYWRGYYDASKACLSLLEMKQTRLEEFASE